MSDPLTIGLLIGGTIASVGGAIYAGNAAAVGADYDASVQQGNAARLDNNAKQLTEENNRRAVEFRRDFTDFAKQQEVRRRKSGVVAESGTALATALESGRRADEELERRRYNAAQGRRDTEDQAAGFRANAINIQMGGRSQQTAAYLKAGKSLMAGGREVYRYW